MAKKDYMPLGEDELLTWFNNMSTKLPGYQLTFGLTAIEVSEFQAEEFPFRHLGPEARQEDLGPEARQEVTPTVRLGYDAHQIPP